MGGGGGGGGEEGRRGGGDGSEGGGEHGLPGVSVTALKQVTHLANTHTAGH